jgi:hypothetical protein
MEKGTTKIAGYEFENEDVVIDFTHFEQCHFKNCKIIYYGHGTFQMVSCDLENCKYELTGPAAAVIQYLRALYHGNNIGGKELVEATFQAIRQPQPYPTDQK